MATQLEEHHSGVSVRTIEVAVAPLPFGHSYWDYLPDLVQDKIFKMVHQQLLKSVNAQIRQLLICPICSRYFEDFEELEYHWDLYSHPKRKVTL